MDLDGFGRQNFRMQQFAVDPEMAVLHVRIYRILAIVETQRTAPVPVLDRDDVPDGLVAGWRTQALRPFRPRSRAFRPPSPLPELGHPQCFTVTRPRDESSRASWSLSSIEIL